MKPSARRGVVAIVVALVGSAALGWAIHRALRSEQEPPRPDETAIEWLRAEMERVASQPRPAPRPVHAGWIAAARAQRRADPAALPAPAIPSLAQRSAPAGGGRDTAGAGAQP